jgi:chorismate--pyruvate lyase
MNTVWQSQQNSEIPQSHQSWLLDEKSLSKKLRDYTHNAISHQLILAEWAHAHLDECQALTIKPTTETWAREIVWNHGQQAWVCARVVIPKHSIENNSELQKILQMHSQSLGDFLFANAELKRSAFEIAHLPTNHFYSLWAHQLTEQTASTKPLWARRSIFYYQSEPILVTEIFLTPFFSSVMTHANK